MDGLLTRPVTADQAHDHARQCEEQDDHDDCFHRIRVPCSLPRIRLIAIADMNMPVMIQNRSI